MTAFVTEAVSCLVQLQAAKQMTIFFVFTLLRLSLRFVTLYWFLLLIHKFRDELTQTLKMEAIFLVVEHVLSILTNISHLFLTFVKLLKRIYFNMFYTWNYTYFKHIISVYNHYNLYV